LIERNELNVNKKLNNSTLNLNSKNVNKQLNKKVYNEIKITEQNTDTDTTIKKRKLLIKRD